MSDKIVLVGLECFGNHGCSAEEQKLGQRFFVDLQLELNLNDLNDEIKNTVDYVEIANVTKSIVAGEHRKLIETVAVDIAETILKQFDKIKSVHVILHKPHSPINFSMQDFAVEIYRQR